MRHTELIIQFRKFSFLIGILCLMVGCEDSLSSGDKDSSSSKHLQDAYLTIALNPFSRTETRSNPTGGENGDGTETGLENENLIENVNVILYTANSINNALTTGITTMFYVDSEDILGGNTTRVKQLKIDKDIYHVIVIANAGDMTGELNGKTVGYIANYLQKSAWTYTNNIYSSFIMTSADDVTVDLTVSTDEANPAVVEVDLQRMAARIDILSYQGENQTNTYSIIDGGQTIANVTVERVKLINRLTAGSYLLKRVAPTSNGTPDYLGNETPVAGNQTNYVLDPWINLKTTANLTGGHFNIDTGGAGTSPATALYADYFNPDFSLAQSDSIRTPLTGRDFYILDYTMENTMDRDYQINGYSTGVMYQTTYLPLLITNYNATTGSNEVINNTNVITFFATGPNNVIYNSLEAIELPYLIDSQSDDFFSQSFTTTNTWQEVSDYADRLRDQDRLGFKAYLDSLLTDQTLSDNLDRPISWNAFVLSNYGYSRTAGNTVINQNGLDTKSLLSDQQIKTYEDGLCYYTYWIRHSNDNTTSSAIMEFGIVRNNIYKLRIASFSALGKPDPYDPDTDNPGNPDEESSIRIVISVRPWRFITHSDIIL